MNLVGFKEIPEHPEYFINESGEVYSTVSNKLLKPTVNGKGYYHFTVRVTSNKYKWLQLHRVLARVFKDLPSLDSELEVDHNDQNTLNFDLENLIVRTKQEHYIKTAIDRGNIPGGNKCCTCGTRIHSTYKYCINCSPSKNRSPDITAEQIEYWVKNYSWVRAGKELGLTDNGLRKRYTKLTGKSPKEIHKSE